MKGELINMKQEWHKEKITAEITQSHYQLCNIHYHELKLANCTTCNSKNIQQFSMERSITMYVPQGEAVNPMLPELNWNMKQ